MAQRPYRVLSLDGGGIRGTYTAAYLERLVGAFARQKGAAALDLGKGFDLIAGTSTGAIIGCGLAKGIALSRIVQLYQDNAKAIFPHHITGKKSYGDLALRAAEQLRRRLIMTPKGSYISSWGQLDDECGRRSSAIDTMANLPLLYWAGLYSGDASFVLAGEAQAIMTRDDFSRPDHSTYHAVEYDLVTGERQRGFTFQGSADESCWPRGQACRI